MYRSQPHFHGQPQQSIPRYQYHPDPDPDLIQPQHPIQPNTSIYLRTQPIRYVPPTLLPSPLFSPPIRNLPRGGCAAWWTNVYKLIGLNHLIILMVFIVFIGLMMAGRGRWTRRWRCRRRWRRRRVTQIRIITTQQPNSSRHL